MEKAAKDALVQKLCSMTVRQLQDRENDLYQEREIIAGLLQDARDAHNKLSKELTRDLWEAIRDKPPPSHEKAVR